MNQTVSSGDVSRIFFFADEIPHGGALFFVYSAMADKTAHCKYPLTCPIFRKQINKTSYPGRYMNLKKEIIIAPLAWNISNIEYI